VDVKSEAKRENTVPADLWSLSRLVAFEMWFHCARKLGLSSGRPSLRQYAGIMEQSLKRYETEIGGDGFSHSADKKVTGVVDSHSHDCIVIPNSFRCA
jgi:hypothetical protein